MKLVILDRDGVINEDSDHYIRSLEEWIPIPGSIDAIARLSKAGFTVAVVTNQSGIGRGYYSLETLQAMHDHLQSLVQAAGGHIDGIFFCPHTPDDHCDCRKPKPGLIDAAAHALGVDVAGAPIIGDSLRDLEAGTVRGCVPLLVRTGKGERTLEKLARSPVTLPGLQVFDDLAAAARYLTEETP